MYYICVIHVHVLRYTCITDIHYGYTDIHVLRIYRVCNVRWTMTYDKELECGMKRSKTLPLIDPTSNPSKPPKMFKIESSDRINQT